MLSSLIQPSLLPSTDTVTMVPPSLSLSLSSLCVACKVFLFWGGTTLYDRKKCGALALYFLWPVVRRVLVNKEVTESIATLPPFGPIEGHKWFDQISSQWESQKNRFALISFGKIQFLPPCIWNLLFMSYSTQLCIYNSSRKPEYEQDTLSAWREKDLELGQYFSRKELFCTYGVNIFIDYRPACRDTGKGGRGERDTGTTMRKGVTSM